MREPRGENRQTICLCMIVKNEAPVIRRCLDSVRPIIDHWIVVDTGSTDATQEIVRTHFHDLPGTLHERPWRDFASNRSEALALAREHGDYSLVIDADDELKIPGDFIMPALDADSYTLDIALGDIRYRRPQLVKNSVSWRYEGVLHEYLACDGTPTSGHLPLLLRVNHDGARRRDPLTYRRDAEILEEALQTETAPFRIARYTFYLAQSYRDCGESEKALAAYLRRAELGFWDQEVFISLYMAGQLQERLREAPEVSLSLYDQASQVCPFRAEARYRASRLCRLRNEFARGYAIAKPAVAFVPPPDGLFVETWIYDYGLLDELAVNAYWAGHYRDCLDAVLRALASGRIPSNEQQRFIANARFALAKLT
jgi:Glycosyl transferase family 2